MSSPQTMCIQGSYVVQVYCWGLEMDVAVQRTGVDFAAQLECREVFYHGRSRNTEKGWGSEISAVLQFCACNLHLER